MARTPFKPTGELRAKVRQLSGMGICQDDIARILEISPKTLRKHFRRELDRGAAEANAAIAGYLFQNAKAGNVAAQIFWLKTRARWKTAPDTEENTPSAGPSDAEQRVFERLVTRIKRQKIGEQP
jgi:predicted ArsR family transcriptional regulator